MDFVGPTGYYAEQGLFKSHPHPFDGNNSEARLDTVHDVRNFLHLLPNPDTAWNYKFQTSDGAYWKGEAAHPVRDDGRDWAVHRSAHFLCSFYDHFTTVWMRQYRGPYGTSDPPPMAHFELWENDIWPDLDWRACNEKGQFVPPHCFETDDANQPIKENVTVYGWGPWAPDADGNLYDLETLEPRIAKWPLSPPDRMYPGYHTVEMYKPDKNILRSQILVAAARFHYLSSLEMGRALSES